MNSILNWFKTIFSEDGGPSIGRALLGVTFLVLVGYWVKFLIIPLHDAPASLTTAFAAELLYVLGGKGAKSVSKIFNGNSVTKPGE